MHGDNVFLPIGFDAFGLPAENAAIKNGINPREWTMANIETMRAPAADDGRERATGTPRSSPATPSYYRWNQWLFLRFLEAGLAYRAVSAGRLVPQRRHARARAGRGRGPPLLAVRREGREARAAAVVPADDQLRRRAARLHRHRLAGARSGSCRPTGSAGRPAREIVFETAPSPHHAGGEELRVFTTRPDTLFGATFMVLAPEHPLVGALTAPDRGPRSRPTSRRPRPRPRSTGCRPTARRPASPIGADAINPVNGERIPIFVADYVLGSYGTGAIMAVPAHDERDFAFATAVRPADRARDHAPGRRPGRGR